MKKMYKVAHLAKPLAGIGVYLKILINHIDDEHVESILIGGKSDITIKNKSNESIHEYSINLFREIKLIKDLIAFKSLLKVLRETKPDLIHCHSAKAGILGRLAGFYLKIPTLYTPHAYSYLSGESPWKRFKYKIFEKSVNLLPAKILACSPSEYDNAHIDLKVKKSKLLIWNNSIRDPKKIKSASLDRTLPELFLCSIGRPSYQKNIQMLIEAFADLSKTFKNVKLVLIGIDEDSKYSQDLLNQIQTLELTSDIILIPWLEREQMLHILKQSLLYLSTSRYEGLSYSIIEALGFEKPCIVTDVDGNNDLIKDGHNGYLVKLNDKVEFKRKITFLLEDKSLYKKMSKNARSTFVENYDIEKNISKIEKIYKNEINS